MLVNTYVLDPSHIAPSRSDANSNGHFPLPSNHHLTNGTPRGFNLQNMNMNLMSFNQNGMMGTSAVPGMTAPFMGGMQPPLNMGDMANGMHNPGAVRRGGGRFNNPRSGPYDRNNRGMQRGFGTVGGMGMGMNMRPGAGVGMGYFAQGGGGGGGKWGEGGGVAMGPREAVQGRSIKSYEDLDAQPGGGAGGRDAATAAAGGAAELDY